MIRAAEPDRSIYLILRISGRIEAGLEISPTG